VGSVKGIKERRSLITQCPANKKFVWDKAENCLLT